MSALHSLPNPRVSLGGAAQGGSVYCATELVVVVERAVADDTSVVNALLVVETEELIRELVPTTGELVVTVELGLCTIGCVVVWLVVELDRDLELETFVPGGLELAEDDGATRLLLLKLPPEVNKVAVVATVDERRVENPASELGLVAELPC